MCNVHCILIIWYAPTTDYSDDVIELYYEHIVETIKQIPCRVVLITMDDWFSKVVAHPT